MSKISVLYLTPNLNHYKIRQLDLLAKVVNLTIISGTGRSSSEDKNIKRLYNFELVQLDVSKKSFGKSNKVISELKKHFKNYDWVLIPAEKKNLLLLLYAIYLRRHHKGTRLFSHNHQYINSKRGKPKRIDILITRFFYKHLDRVIFYTKDSCEKAIQGHLIAPEKAFWANNTVDNTEIEKYYSFQLPPKEQQTILFIGRLIPSKRIADVIKYYNALKSKFQQLKLEIIGDGPEQAIVKSALNNDLNIIWHGTLVDESIIAPIMERASVVFIPGLSGLSINHAFAYGRPYFTMNADKHGPEISYLENGVNGFILTDNLREDLPLLINILENRKRLVQLCNNAKQKGDELSIQMWVQQLKESLLND